MKRNVVQSLQGLPKGVCESFVLESRSAPLATRISSIVS